MGKIWTKGFWKDSAERTISAVCQALLMFTSTDILGEAGSVPITIDWMAWQTWLNVIATAAILQMLKNLIAGTTNPMSGASFGASVPSDSAISTLDREGQPVIGPSPEAPGIKGEPAQVQALPPVETTGTP